MTDLTAGKIYDRVAQTWLEPDEYHRRRAEYEERAFQRRPTQGQLATPMIISDTQRGLMSMTNGKIYDSKSEMRKEYRRAGVIEVGNEVPMKRPEPTRDEKRKARERRRGALAGALSKAGFGAP